MHELDELGQRWIPAELSERSAENLRLIECLRYISGIAKRGTGREQGANESVEQFILGYVKELEAERDRYRNLLFEALNYPRMNCSTDSLIVKGRDGRRIQNG